MNYKPFYSIIRRYVNNKITRLRFEHDWKLEQQEQGLADNQGQKAASSQAPREARP